jgi:RecA/RadA recombinase
VVYIEDSVANLQRARDFAVSSNAEVRLIYVGPERDTGFESYEGIEMLAAELHEKPLTGTLIVSDMDGGIERGLLMLAGPSKSFKTSFSLEMVAAYLNARPAAICLFFDGEFGAKKQYFEQFNVPTDRILHLPFENIEQLKFEMSAQLTNVELGEDVICLIDSIGNAASKKEVEDSMEQKSVADMSRAKSLASLFRIITPKLYLKRIPCIVVNHTLKTMDFFPVDLPKGGNGGIYSSNTIWLIGKNKLKEKEEHTGYKFLIKIYKSRDIKDNAMFPVTVRFEGGIAKWSGLDELAVQLGVITKCKDGRFFHITLILNSICTVLISMR